MTAEVTGETRHAGGQEATDHDPERDRHDQAADGTQRGPAQDDRETDADEDERPDAPPAGDLVGCQRASMDGERDGPDDDEEEAPAEERTIDSHHITAQRVPGEAHRPNAKVRARHPVC